MSGDTLTQLFAVSILICLILFGIALGSCIPKVPDQVIEEVRACYIPEVIPKSTLPTVKYIFVDGYKCFADIDQMLNARKRESLIKMDSNNCRDQYKDVQQRCDPRGE